MEEPIRIAQIMGNMNSGGVESVIMNYYRRIDRSKFQFDFICNEGSSLPQRKDIEKLGGRIFIVPSYSHIFAYMKEMRRIFRENKYQIVHSNVTTLSVFPLKAAKKEGVPVRIAHAHSTSNKKELLRNLIKDLLRPFSKKYSNKFFACSETAGAYLFGKKAVREGKVVIINNAVDTKRFAFDEKAREEVRKELHLEDKFVIGNIGRLCSAKNHLFILEVLKEGLKNDSLHLLLIGEGKLKEKILQRAKEYGVADHMTLLEPTPTPEKYYSAMDCLIFPSLYEGLGLAAIEAQFNNLPCLASTNVPEEANISSGFSSLSLDDPIEKWVEAMEEKKRSRKEKFVYNEKASLFDIDSQVKVLEKMYEEFSRK